MTGILATILYSVLKSRRFPYYVKEIAVSVLEKKKKRNRNEVCRHPNPFSGYLLCCK